MVKSRSFIVGFYLGALASCLACMILFVSVKYQQQLQTEARYVRTKDLECSTESCDTEIRESLYGVTNPRDYTRVTFWK